MMVIMCLSVLLKVASKAWKTHTLERDDYSVLAAMVGTFHLLLSRTSSSLEC